MQQFVAVPICWFAVLVSVALAAATAAGVWYSSVGNRPRYLFLVGTCDCVWFDVLESIQKSLILPW